MKFLKLDSEYGFICGLCVAAVLISCILTYFAIFGSDDKLFSEDNPKNTIATEETYNET